MKLTFNDLKKKDVINTVDGRCLGRITDLTLDFPDGVMVGITVPGKKTKWFLRFLDKSDLFIPDDRIKKIGSDVILVNLACGEVCAPSVRAKPDKKPPVPCPPPVFPCGCDEKDDVDY